MNRVEFLENIVANYLHKSFETAMFLRCERCITHVKTAEEVVRYTAVEDNRLYFTVNNATYDEMYEACDMVHCEQVQCCFEGYVELNHKGRPSVEITKHIIF